MKLVADHYVDEYEAAPAPETLGGAPGAPGALRYVWLRPNRWLVAGLVVSLVATLALGVALYRQARQDQSRHRATATVTAYLEAWNSHDAMSVLRLMTPYSAIDVGGIPGQQAGEHYEGDALLAYLDFFLHDDTGFIGTPTGPIAVTQSGALHLAAVPLRVRYFAGPGQPQSQMNCQALFVLTEHDGELRVFRHFSWRCASLPAPQPPR